MGWTNVPRPIFKMAVKTISHRFFENHEIFCFFVLKIFIFYDNLINSPCIHGIKLSLCSGLDLTVI